MSLPETIVLDVPNLLTLLGVAVAILSAMFASRSATSARRQAEAAESALKESRAQSAITRAALAAAKAQNSISMHGHRLEAYKSLLSFSSQLNAGGVHFNRNFTWALWEHAQLAEFYFSTEVATSLKSIVDLSMQLQISRERWSEESGVESSARPALVQASHDQHRRILEAVAVTDQQMRKELRLVQREG